MEDLSGLGRHVEINPVARSELPQGSVLPAVLGAPSLQLRSPACIASHSIFSHSLLKGSQQSAVTFCAFHGWGAEGQT